MIKVGSIFPNVQIRHQELCDFYQTSQTCRATNPLFVNESTECVLSSDHYLPWETWLVLIVETEMLIFIEHQNHYLFSVMGFFSCSCQAQAPFFNSWEAHFDFQNHADLKLICTLNSLGMYVFSMIHMIVSISDNATQNCGSSEATFLWYTSIRFFIDCIIANHFMKSML